MKFKGQFEIVKQFKLSCSFLRIVCVVDGEIDEVLDEYSVRELVFTVTGNF